MNESHIPFLSRCALILFAAGLILPPVIYALSSRGDAEGASLFVAAICLGLSLTLAIVGRGQLPARIVLIGLPIVLCLFAALCVFAVFRRAQVRAEFESQLAFDRAAEARARVAKREAEDRARNEARRSQPENSPQKP
jgi:hypothetical protein